MSARLTRRVAGRYRRTPLRVKLIASMLLLVLVGLVTAALVGAAMLRGYLVGRVDSQLRAAQNSISQKGLTGLSGLTSDTPDGHGRGNDGDHSRLPSDFVVAVNNSAGNLVYGPTSELIDPTQPLPSLPHTTGAQSAAAGASTFTVDAVSGNTQWRILAVEYTLSDGSKGTLLIAQSLGAVESTVGHFEALSSVIGVITAVVLAGVGYIVIRVSLRPLRAVERTAAEITAGDLSHRVPNADPHTEVGQVSQALNTMLAQIETAFAEREASERAALWSEHQMRRSEGAPRESEQRMRRFIADASHELRTPLTSIRGFAELFRQGAATSDQDITRYMQRIESEATRMGVLVEDLLLLARMDEERPLARLPVDLLALVGDAVHDARVVAPDRHIALEVGATDPPPVVLGDEARLRQVLGNLVSNALRHTPAGTDVTVRVGTETVGPERGWVRLEVSDQGQGLAAADAEHVFERFYRADRARSNNGGSGLGLAIVAALVAGHQGRIDLETASGAGATFRVLLPLADAPVAVDALH